MQLLRNNCLVFEVAGGQVAVGLVGGGRRARVLLLRFEAGQDAVVVGQQVINAHGRSDGRAFVQEPAGPVKFPVPGAGFRQVREESGQVLRRHLLRVLPDKRYAPLQVLSR